MPRKVTRLPKSSPASETPVTAVAPPHVIIEAKAGSGKTTTLVEGLKLLFGQTPKITPSSQQQAIWDSLVLSKGVRTIGFFAFNKSIATELQNRVPSGVEASTMHSLGFKAVRARFGNVAVNQYRVSDIICNIMQKDPRELRKSDPELLRATSDLVGLCKMNLVGPSGGYSWSAGEWEDALDDLARHYSIEMNGSRSKVYDLVPKVLAQCLRTDLDKSIDYDDMIWLPVALNLSVRRYGLLLGDEVQDWNRCQQALARMSGDRLTLVGDSNQAIYGFCGADSESMPRMYEELSQTASGCIKLPLTVTRRCGKAIVREANKIVPDFDAHETNGEGQVIDLPWSGKKDKPAEGESSKPVPYTDHVSAGDMILCRVNAPLVSECFKFLKQGRKANIQGRDVAKGLISTVTKSKTYYVADLVSYLSDWLHDETQKELKKRNPDDGRLIAIQDRYDCLMAFTEGMKTTEEVVKRIESVFVDVDGNKDRSGGILLSSVHRAKGLESSRVFILLPKKGGMPHPMSRSEWAKQQEQHLIYVAITRAIECLFWVRDDRKSEAAVSDE